MKMPSLLLLLTAAATASTALADQVLVLGNAPTQLFHESASSSAFSAAGLADLALNSLGLRTGRVSTRSAVQSPLQADVFTQSEAYALLLLDDASAGALDVVDAALSGSKAFHAVYPSQPANIKVPAAVAQEFQAKYRVGVRCAGSVALCASVEADAPSVAADVVQDVLKANSFLDAGDAADVAFARELAQVMQLTAAQTKQQGERKTLYVVGLSGLEGEKQKMAQQAVATTVTEFLAQLMKNSELAGAQVMTGKLPVATQQVAALSRRARNRKLVSGLTNEEDEEDDEESDSESDSASDSDSAGNSEEDEEETEDLAAQSGSVWEEVGDDNSTSTANTTAPGAVSMPDIAEYQIILWTSVLLGAVLLMAVLAMGNMDTGRDSLLYAKFIADVNGRKTN
ncbi:hypothetical protein PF005_g3854 [Phytophthora fragariae]|uniref:Uncharacterized protein n=1 Tax=Phytophthora fragariae TaxID=53985 RepID=A0A6A4ELS8_9STRA|nr:hypothetical protein PF003_g2411 [Phytophthora fragariae]KAE8946325.1 hypothetical protein PF009_g4026 [Phytophthora fragariae]KAE9132060.1 hypothetical protein PF007_g3859 [Phytophthora fragariae]KAE9148371.1 hypothetical protein PF006_g7023 [Phytophthora fragariae]KAE9225740.1 hypothetical protein PF002_g14309 [Phytophthora fragariae]